MPLGTELVSQISGLVGFKRDESTGRLPEHNNFVRSLINFAGPKELPNYERAAAQMIAGMPSAESVDRFIDRNRNDDYIRTLGKAAIIKAISFRERKSKLVRDKGEPITDKSEIHDTWYWTFVRMLLEGSPPPENIFDDVAVICFNYDRCIEHYLTCEMMRSYFVDRNAASKLISRLAIWHPYGTIAPHETREPNGIAFGDHESLSGRYFHLAPRIKTFTEKYEDWDTITGIRKRIQDADTIVFLGFGFYQQNLDLIAPNAHTNIKWILGTGFGLSDSARRIVTRRLVDWNKGSSSPEIEVPHMKCVSLLNYYRMALTA